MTSPVSAPSYVLIVEDNLLIAMETEYMFRSLGCEHVEITPNLCRARELVSQSRPDFVLLDVNLGTHTTHDLALELIAASIPIGFATGYSDHVSFPEALRDIPRILKPYGREDLVKLLEMDVAQFSSTRQPPDH